MKDQLVDALGRARRVKLDDVLGDLAAQGAQRRSAEPSGSTNGGRAKADVVARILDWASQPPARLEARLQYRVERTRLLIGRSRDRCVQFTTRMPAGRTSQDFSPTWVRRAPEHGRSRIVNGFSEKVTLIAGVAP